MRHKLPLFLRLEATRFFRTSHHLLIPFLVALWVILVFSLAGLGTQVSAADTAYMNYALLWLCAGLSLLLGADRLFDADHKNGLLEQIFLGAELLYYFGACPSFCRHARSVFLSDLSADFGLAAWHAGCRSVFICRLFPSWSARFLYDLGLGSGHWRQFLRPRRCRLHSGVGLASSLCAGGLVVYVGTHRTGRFSVFYAMPAGAFFDACGIVGVGS